MVFVVVCLLGVCVCVCVCVFCFLVRTLLLDVELFH